MEKIPTSHTWVNFFQDAGIPDDLSAQYAVMFTDHRIHRDMLAELDREILSDIGVKAVGDKMAILKHARFISEQSKRDASSKELASGLKKPTKTSVASERPKAAERPNPSTVPVPKKKIKLITTAVSRTVDKSPRTEQGVINQLASLSQHAEDIFGELFSEANSFYGRASSLKDRIENLSVKVTQLDSNIEEVQLIDINSRKAFKSSVLTDQQVVSRQSLPKSVLDTYNQADAPPPLQDLNQFRDDGKDGLKIYTDPDYFFNLWREAIQKETREAKEKRREQRRKDRKGNYHLRREEGKVRQAVNTRKQQAQRLRHGAEFVDSTTPKATSQQSVRKTSMKKQPQPMPQKDYVPTPAETNIADLPPPSELPPPAEEPFSYPGVPPPESSAYHPPPPPLEPPPPPQHINDIPPPPAPMAHAPPPPPAPAPPPPPPPPVAPSSGGDGMSGLGAQLQNVSLKKAEPQPVVVDERSNLLQAIRIGINLKKVEQKEQSQAPTSASNDVASILARRIAVEFSDSDVSDSTFASDDDEWND